jgi:hypothetical protein
VETTIVTIIAGFVAAGGAHVGGHLDAGDLTEASSTPRARRHPLEDDPAPLCVALV